MLRKSFHLKTSPLLKIENSTHNNDVLIIIIIGDRIRREHKLIEKPTISIPIATFEIYIQLFFLESSIQIQTMVKMKNFSIRLYGLKHKLFLLVGGHTDRE